jgi:hypothetical protein
MSPSNAAVDALLERHFQITGTWNLNAQGLVDVQGNVIGETQPKDRLCVQFGYVSGNFTFAGISLRTLEGAPHTVDGRFECFQTKLHSLKGAPRTVGSDFQVGNNQLTSLQGGPQEVGGNYGAHLNHLTSLEGAPSTVGGRFFITYYPDTPLLKLFNYKRINFIKGDAPMPEIWQDLFNPIKHQELQGGGKVAMMKAVAILSKVGLYKNNPNAQL